MTRELGKMFHTLSSSWRCWAVRLFCCLHLCAPQRTSTAAEFIWRLESLEHLKNHLHYLFLRHDFHLHIKVKSMPLWTVIFNVQNMDSTPVYETRLVIPCSFSWFWFQHIAAWHEFLINWNGQLDTSVSGVFMLKWYLYNVYSFEVEASIFTVGSTVGFPLKGFSPYIP